VCIFGPWFFAAPPGDPQGGQLLWRQGGSALVPGDGMGLRQEETWQLEDFGALGND